MQMAVYDLISVSRHRENYKKKVRDIEKSFTMHIFLLYVSKTSI